MCSKEHGFRRTKTVFETVGLSSPSEGESDTHNEIIGVDIICFKKLFVSQSLCYKNSIQGNPFQVD